MIWQFPDQFTVAAVVFCRIAGRCFRQIGHYGKPMAIAGTIKEPELHLLKAQEVRLTMRRASKRTGFA